MRVSYVLYERFASVYSGIDLFLHFIGYITLPIYLRWPPQLHNHNQLSLSLVYSYLAHAEIEELKKQSSDVLAEAYLQSVLARAYALFLTSEQPDVDTVFQVKHSDIILLFFFFPHVVSADER